MKGKLGVPYRLPVGMTFEAGFDPSKPDDLRAQGLQVSTHNDIVHNGVLGTLWIFIRSMDRKIFRGEGGSDAEALNQVRAQLKNEAAR